MLVVGVLVTFMVEADVGNVNGGINVVFCLLFPVVDGAVDVVVNLAQDIGALVVDVDVVNNVDVFVVDVVDVVAVVGGGVYIYWHTKGLE